MLNLKSNSTSTQDPVIRGWWQFKNNLDGSFLDSVENGNKLTATGNPSSIKVDDLFSGVDLNGIDQWLSTTKPVLQTEDSYSIAAWVRLDSVKLNGKLALKPGEHALTAVSQDSATHSAFYLGVRQIDEKQKDGLFKSSLKWNFTVSPIDGSETGPVEWQHAYIKSSLDDSILDKWVLLVGVCDAMNRKVNIYVPSTGEQGTINMPNELILLSADQGLQIGRGRWLGRSVDQWPGSVGPVMVFSGVLTEKDAKKLYTEGTI